MIAENLIPLAVLAALLIIAYGVLRWRTVLRRRRDSAALRDRYAPVTSQKRGLFGRLAPPRWVLVDGSNVMHWDGGTPNIAPVKAVVAELARRGMTPGVVFDANAGYLLTGQYRHDFALGQMLGLPADRVMVVPKGTVADTYILAAARDLRAKVVTNDRYRDWSDAHPEVLEPGFLIRGGVREGAVWVE